MQGDEIWSFSVAQLIRASLQYGPNAAEKLKPKANEQAWEFDDSQYLPTIAVTGHNKACERNSEGSA